MEKLVDQQKRKVADDHGAQCQPSNLCCRVLTQNLRNYSRRRDEYKRSSTKALQNVKWKNKIK